MTSEKVLIFTDLDGTLLDHYTYQADAALETIAQIKSANIPIILNTSKTLAELASIREELALDTPFIIENGAAVFIPKTTFTTQPAGTRETGEYWIKEFSSSQEHWLDLLENGMTEFEGQYTGFSKFSERELSELTGLSLANATQAKQRQYGEPIQWLGDEPTKQRFINRLVDLGANVVQGGRFIHVGGYCDKGQALIWLTEQYRRHFSDQTLYTIALGDGENDIAMLEAADKAVQVRSPVHDFPSLYRKYKTTQTTLYGPAGWAEALQALLFTQPLTQSKTR